MAERPEIPLPEGPARTPDDERTLSEESSVYAGRYRVDSELGRGGMGRVLRARDMKLDREVALKVLPPGPHDQHQRERFEQEARAAAALNHPNILAVYDVGEHRGEPYIVSELLEGETLRHVLARGPMPERDALELARQLADALAAAHAKNIVHRDLKPENLFLGADGRLKILDFGIAKLLAGHKPLAHTDTGAVIGTPAYMSPEQVRGEPADTRSDVFSFGCVVYEMLAGKAPFELGGSVETAYAILHDVPAPLPAFVDARLSRLIARSLEKNPAARYANAGAILEELGGPRKRLEVALRPPRRFAIPIASVLLVVAGVLALDHFMQRGTKIEPLAALRPSSFDADVRDLLRVFRTNPDAVPPWFIQRLRANVEQLLADPRTRLEVYPRMKLYWPLVARKLVEHGLPEELGYVAWVESRFDPQARTGLPTDAAGLWGFIPQTARQYGLRVEPEHDDRLDPALPSEAGAKYLVNLMADFGFDSFLALASYNKGESGLRRILRELAQKPGGLRPEDRTFWHLYRLQALPEETMEYVPQVLAVAIVCRNPGRYGLE